MYGGESFSIGPPTFVRSETPTDFLLSLNLHRLDIDPFKVRTEFNFLYTPSALFVANLFEATQNADWLKLMVYCHWISTVPKLLHKMLK